MVPKVDSHLGEQGCHDSSVDEHVPDVLVRSLVGGLRPTRKFHFSLVSNLHASLHAGVPFAFPPVENENFPVSALSPAPLEGKCWVMASLREEITPLLALT